jgi:hypothetical protein
MNRKMSPAREPTEEGHHRRLVVPGVLGAATLLALGSWFLSVAPHPSDPVMHATSVIRGPSKTIEGGTRSGPPQRESRGEARVWQRRDGSGTLVELTNARKPESSGKSWQGLAVELSDEEQAVLQEHPIEELGQLTAKAQQAYRNSVEPDRDEAKRRYLMLLNLGAKVVLYERPEPTPELLHAQQQYLSAVRAAQKSGKPMSEKAQGEFKRSLLANQIKREQVGFKTSGDRP